MKNQRIIRPLWILYALALITATHWPGLTVPAGPVSRMDLVIHASAFGLWTLLFYHCGWIGAKQCPRRRVIWTGVVGIIYAPFDELTQPIFNRTADPLDLAADIGGVVVMCILITIAHSMVPSARKVRSEES